MMKDKKDFKIEFAQFSGEMAGQFSFNKSLGQIYGLLYINNDLMSLESIAKTLSMSKGNASINLRVLESWGAVRSVWVTGSRKDHYKANPDIYEIIMKRIREGLERRFEIADERILHLLSESPMKNTEKKDPFVEERLNHLRSLFKKSKKAIRYMPRLLGFLKKLP